MAAQITDEHIAAFATESTWDGLADALTSRNTPTSALARATTSLSAPGDQQRVERYGEVARQVSVRSAAA
jgi:hypothetical protein